MADAATLLTDPNATPDAIETALAAVLRDGTTDDFAKAFGPRRLLNLLAKGRLSEHAAELADELLAIPAQSGGVGLAGGLDFTEVLHHDELFPDELVELFTASDAFPPAPVAPADDDGLLALHRPLASGGLASFSPASCRLVYSSTTNGEPEEGEEGGGAATAAAAPTLRLLSLSRRSRIGSEIECKVWPSAAILGRWLWRHRPLVEGSNILELGAGVGTAGLAAAACGARRVVITDINATALKCAKANCERNGEAARAAARVAHLDWARPPLLDAAATASPADATEEDKEVAALLRAPFEVILAADVINNEGLSEMVYRMIQLYLAPRGVFLMVCPKPRHRHTVEKIRRLLLESNELTAVATPVPEGLLDGLGEEAHLLEHELVVAQWTHGRRGGGDGPTQDEGAAIALEAPARL